MAPRHCEAYGPFSRGAGVLGARESIDPAVKYVKSSGAITPSPSVLAGRAARCIGQPFNGRGACAAKSPFHPLPRGEREV